MPASLHRPTPATQTVCRPPAKQRTSPSISDSPPPITPPRCTPPVQVWCPPVRRPCTQPALWEGCPSTRTRLSKSSPLTFVLQPPQALQTGQSRSSCRPGIQSLSLSPFIVHSSLRFIQARGQLCSLSRWQCPPSGALFFLSPCLRPVWHPPHQHRDLGQGHPSLFPYHQDEASGRAREQQISLSVNTRLRYLIRLIDAFSLIDCGIRPATAAEAEWLQDYIQKSNNNAAQASVNAARHAEATNRPEDRSSDDEEEGSEGASSLPGSKRNSLLLGDVKNLQFDDLSDKTPTAATLLSQAQSVTRPIGTFPPTASIRRFPTQGSNLGLPAASSSAVGSTPFVAPQTNTSVRQFPNFPSIEDAVANSTSSPGMVAREVWTWFQDHLDALLETIRTFRVDQFEMHLRTFWTSLNGVHREIVHAPAIAGIMAKADAMVYDVCCLDFYSLITPSHMSSHRKSLKSCVRRCCHLFLQRLSLVFASLH